MTIFSQIFIKIFNKILYHLKYMLLSKQYIYQSISIFVCSLHDHITNINWIDYNTQISILSYISSDEKIHLATRKNNM